MARSGVSKITDRVEGVEVEDLEGPRIDRRTSLKLLTLAGVAIPSSLAGCTGDGDGAGEDGSGGDGGDGTSDGQSGSPKMGGTLTIGINADEIVHTHPFMTSLVDDNNLADPIYSHLWRYNDNFEIIGDAAEDWEYIDDTTLRVKIRENINFHNGYGQATSEDVKYSLNLLGETEQSPNTSQRKEWIDSIETPDDYTVLITHPHVFAPYIPLTTSRPMLGRLVSREAYEELGFEGFQDMPIGSGPFVLTERNRGDSFTLEKHEDWHKTDDQGNQLPYLDRIEGKLIPEPATLFNALRTGEVDWVNKLTFELYESANQEDQLNAYPVEIGGFLAVTMMCSNPAEVADKAVLAGYFDEADEYNDLEPPTLDVAVRKAISKAIDRQDVSERATFGIGRPSHLLWPASISYIWEDDETGSQLRDEPAQVYDPDEAERILDEAGYTGDPRLELTFLVNKPNERVGQVIAEHLRNVGIEANLRVQESATFWPEFYSYKYPLGLTSAGGGSDPWVVTYRQLGIPEEGTSKGVWQKQLWFDEEFDEVVSKLNQAPYRSDERLSMVKGLEDRFLDEEAGYPQAQAVEYAYPGAGHVDLRGAGQGNTAVENPFGWNYFRRMWIDR